MAFRLTLILLLVIFGAMYLAPDAPPRADRAPVVADNSTSAPAPVPSTSAEVPQTVPPPPAALVPAPAGTDRAPVPARDTAAATAPDAGPDVGPDVAAAGSDAAPDGGPDGGPVVLPGLIFDDPGNDAAAALSMSDAARARAADAAADATTDLLRGLVGDLTPAAPNSQTPPPAGAPQPTDPLPPPAGDLARITGTEVNLRAGPSTAAAVVGRVTEGQTVRVLTPDRDGWSGIEDPASGDEVFIASRFLDILR